MCDSKNWNAADIRSILTLDTFFSLYHNAMILMPNNGEI